MSKSKKTEAVQVTFDVLGHKMTREEAEDLYESLGKALGKEVAPFDFGRFMSAPGKDRYIPAPIPPPQWFPLSDDTYGEHTPGKRFKVTCAPESR